MPLDGMDKIVSKAYKIEDFLNKFLTIMKQNREFFKLNPDNQVTILAEEYKRWVLEQYQTANSITLNDINPLLPDASHYIKNSHEYLNNTFSCMSSFIYAKLQNDYLTLEQFIEYIQNEPNYHKYYDLIDYLNHLKLHKQVYLLRQNVLATFEHKGKQGAKRALYNLITLGTLKGFSKFRLVDITKPDKINYRKELANSIKPYNQVNNGEIISVMYTQLREFKKGSKFNDQNLGEIIGHYINELLISYRREIFDLLILTNCKVIGCDHTIAMIKKYILEKKLNVFTYSDVLNKQLLQKYLPPSNIISLIGDILKRNNVDITGLTDDEKITCYVNSMEVTSAKLK